MTALKGAQGNKMGGNNPGFIWLWITTIGIRLPLDPVQATAHVQNEKLHDE